MKITNWLFAIVIAALLAAGAGGCKKQESASAQPATLEDTLTHLRSALVPASPDLQRAYYQNVENTIRYGRYPEALAALTQISSDPSLNEQQKKLLEQAVEQLKQRMAAPPR